MGPDATDKGVSSCCTSRNTEPQDGTTWHYPDTNVIAVSETVAAEPAVSSDPSV